MCLPFIAAGAGIAASQALAVNAILTTSLVAGLAGTAVSVAGSVQQGKAAEEQSKYEAKLANYEAALEKQRGDVELVRFGVQARREWGRFMLQQAASARDLTFGNAAQQAIETRKFQAFDKDIIARNVEARQVSLRLSASAARARGRNERTGAFLGAAATGVSGFGQALSRGVQFASLGNASFVNAGLFGQDF